MQKKIRSTRGSILIVALSVVMVGACASEEQDQGGGPTESEPVSIRFQLAWTASANAMEYIVADAMGFYEEEGLDVEVIESQDPTAAVGLVGSGEREMGVSYPPDIFLAAAEGVPVRGVWAQYQVNPLGIVSLSSTGIAGPADLAGKTIGLTPLPIDQLLFDVVLAEAGLTRGDMEVVDPGFNGGTLVGEGTLDGASGVPWFEVVGLRVAGEEPELLQYRDHGGLDFPFQTVIAHGDFADENPEAVAAFIRATIRAHEYAVENPGEAVDLVMGAYPQLDRAAQETMWREIIPLAESELTGEHNLGYLNIDQLQALADFLGEGGLLAEEVDAGAVFTNEFQPSD